jgi:Ca2+-dependent lipid-binding protein
MEKESSRSIKLTILAALGIPIGDAETYSCDPYVKISFIDESNEKVVKIGKTKICKKVHCSRFPLLWPHHSNFCIQTLSPIWNETFEFELRAATLKLSLWVRSRTNVFDPPKP